MKPGGIPDAGDPAKLVTVEHPVFKTGWVSAAAFKTVSFHPPLRLTGRLSDIAVGMARTPAFAAIDIRTQRTSTASGEFRSGPRERRDFCKSYWGDDQTEQLNSCMSEPDATLKASANCGARQVAVDGRRYGLLDRPRDAASDIHVDEHRKMLFRDLTSGEWLDGSTVSGEALIMTAFNALCPGVDPEASFGLVYRDPGAQYPRELLGRWFDDRRACKDPRRSQLDYDAYGVLTISPQERSGTRDFEFPQRVNAVRRVGQAAWAVDGSHTIDDVEQPEIFGNTTYTLTRGGLSLKKDGTTSTWVQCR